jgi:hypothetical protein
MRESLYFTDLPKRYLKGVDDSLILNVEHCEQVRFLCGLPVLGNRKFMILFIKNDDSEEGVFMEKIMSSVSRGKEGSGAWVKCQSKEQRKKVLKEKREQLVGYSGPCL